jgi:hypothetical protein
MAAGDAGKAGRRAEVDGFDSAGDERHSLTVPSRLARRTGPGQAGCVTSAPIVVHRPFHTGGGRRVTVNRRGQDELLGTAYSDHDLVVFLEDVGVAEPEGILDDPQWGSGALVPPISSAPPEVRQE